MWKLIAEIITLVAALGEKLRQVLTEIKELRTEFKELRLEVNELTQERHHHRTEIKQLNQELNEVTSEFHRLADQIHRESHEQSKLLRSLKIAMLEFALHLPRVRAGEKQEDIE